MFYQGRRVDEVRKKSDLMLIFLLKARRPEVYRERFDVKNEHSLGSSVTEELIKGLSDEQLEKLEADGTYGQPGYNVTGYVRRQR